MRPRLDRSSLLVGVALAALGVLLLLDALGVLDASAAAVAPLLLALLGLALLTRAHDDWRA